MDYIELARSIAGLLVVVVLLGLVILQTVTPETVPGSTIALLLTLIGALLGVDLASDVLPLQLTLESGDNEGDEGDELR